MNPAVRDYVESVARRHTAFRVLELGAYDVNGNVRDLFPSVERYIGVDQRPGPNVDLVANAHDIPFGADMFDTVICLEMLEHDTDPFCTMCAIAEHLEPGGLAIVTTRGIGYGLHDEPEDYFRFTEHGLRLLMVQAGLKDIEITIHEKSKGVFGYGRA